MSICAFHLVREGVCTHLSLGDRVRVRISASVHLFVTAWAAACLQFPIICIRLPVVWESPRVCPSGRI